MAEFSGQRVLFITTKNLDYLRNTQEIENIKEQGGNVKVIGSNSQKYIVRLLHVYSRLLFCSMKEIDKVFIGFAPQLVLPVFGWKFKKKEIWIDFFISMYDTLAFDRKKVKPDSLPAKILKWFDCKTIQKADQVIVDTKAHGDYFTEEFGLDTQRCHVLYLKADQNIYYPRVQNKPQRMKDRFVVLYFGSVLPLQGLDTILEAVDILKDHRDMYFVIVGPIKDSFIKPISDSVEYHDWLSQKDLAEYISYSDLCLAGHFNKAINKAKRTIPGKAYIYRAMQKPMILGDNAATHELYNEDMPGIYFVEMGNAHKLAECIEKIAEKEKSE